MKSQSKFNRNQKGALAGNRKGSTFVELIVGFVVLVLLIGTFTKVVTQSSKLLKRSQEIRENTESMLSSFYKQKHDAAETPKVAVTINEKGETLQLIYDGEKIKLENQKIRVVTGNEITIYEFKEEEP